MCMQNRKQITEQNNVFLTESEVLQRLQKSSVYYCRYQALNDDWKKKFMDFCTGKKTLPLTYDPFFKNIFHPEVHPHRLSGLLSSLLNRQVRVLKILPTEEVLLDGGAFFHPSCVLLQVVRTS